MGDVVDAIKVLCSLLVIHVLPLSAHDFQRIGLVEELARFAAITIRECKIGSAHRIVLYRISRKKKLKLSILLRNFINRT